LFTTDEAKLRRTGRNPDEQHCWIVEQFLEYLRCVLEPFDDLFPEDQLSFRQTICEILPGRFHQLRIIRAVFDDLAARTAEISAEEQALRPVVFGVEWR
jgi:hypothetical protein